MDTIEPKKQTHNDACNRWRMSHREKYNEYNRLYMREHGKKYYNSAKTKARNAYKKEWLALCSIMLSE